MENPPAVVPATTRAAAVAELFWTGRGPDGPAIETSVGTPLWLNQGPAFAFTYAEYGRAHRLGAAERAAVVYSDQRLSGPGWRPLAVLGRPVLTPDPDGEFFTEQLLEQELRKFPPSRALADSAMLRREHWWYLPRLIVTLEIDAIAPIRERSGGPGSAVLARLDGDQLDVSALTIDELDALLADGPTGVAGGIPASALGHDFTPDLEQQLTWSVRGQLVDDRLRVRERIHQPATATGLTLWQRLVRHRELSQACRRNLPD